MFSFLLTVLLTQKHTTEAVQDMHDDGSTTTTEWETPEIWLEEVCFSLDSPKTERFNFATTIGKRINKNQPIPSNAEKVYLPASYNQNCRQYRSDTITPLFSRACAQAGFEVHNHGWETAYNCIRFKCFRGRTFQHRIPNGAQVRSYLHRMETPFLLVEPIIFSHFTPSSIRFIQRQRNTVTKRPLDKKDKCPFLFSIFWDPALSRWWFPLLGGGCSTHRGHCRKELPEQVKAQPTKNVGEDNVNEFGGGDDSWSMGVEDGVK